MNSIEWQTVARFAALLVKKSVRARRVPDTQLFFEAAYPAFFKRDPDPQGVKDQSVLLHSSKLGPYHVLRRFMESREFQAVQGLPMHPLHALHHSRAQLVREALPAARVIVDLGGGSTDSPEGALLGMGYPHTPERIWIIDLPPEERLLHSADTSDTYITEKGTEVRYLYRSMTDLSGIEDGSVDMVFSGESIEHISEADGDIVCQEAWRVLRPGGFFCLDTPNGALTRIESPDALTHPEHQKEYRVEELRDKLLRHGFQIADELGICAMPGVVATGEWSYREMAIYPGLHDDPESCYLFYIKAQKPFER